MNKTFADKRTAAIFEGFAGYEKAAQGDPEHRPAQAEADRRRLATLDSLRNAQGNRLEAA